MRPVLPPLLLACILTGAVPVMAQSVGEELSNAMPSSPPALAIKPAPPVAAVAPAPASSTTSPTAAPAPPADPYAVADVPADVHADTAAHARDQALLQAERAAFVQLCARLNPNDTAAVKITDDALAALVQSFEVQSEHVSAVRYIAIFTIRFKPSAVRRRLGSAAPPSDAAAAGTAAGTSAPAARPAPALPVSHLPVAVETESLAAFGQIKRRLGNVPQITRVDTIALGHGTSHVDLAYTGCIEDLQNAVTGQGFVLRQDAGGWTLTDTSMVPR